MSDDYTDFKHELGRELVAAARREQPSSSRVHRRQWRPSPLAALSGFILIAAVGIVTLSFTRSEPAAAQVFEVSITGDGIVLEVVDVVTDPDAVAQQLREEVGIIATLSGQAAPPELGGQITAFSSTGVVELATRTNDRGIIDQVVIPPGFNGSLLIQYGRAARPGESYEATTDDVRCAALWGTTPDQASDALTALASLLRFQTVSADGGIAIDVEYESIGSTYRLVSIISLSDDSALVTFSEDPSTWPRHPNCA